MLYSPLFAQCCTSREVYNKEKNILHIEDPENLTEDEKSAIMIILTGNPDIYSYAAENQFHADAHGIIGIFDSHTIISDAGVGESDIAESYEGLFKDKEGTYYGAQLNAHNTEEVMINE